MRRARLGSVLGLLLFAGGCLFQNVSAEERLRDAVVGYNDEMRWNRIDLATQRVAPPYRARFAATHRQWGRGLQIADSEIVHVEVADDRDHATSRVEVHWIDPSTMLVADSTLVQRWERYAGGYVLVDETIGEGHPGLLASESDEEAQSR